MSLLLLLRSNITGSLAATEAVDTGSASGTVFTLSFTLATTENADYSTTSKYWFQYWQGPYWSVNYWHSIPAQFSGVVEEAESVEGALDASEAADTAALSGVVLVSGTLAATEAADTASISGTVTVAGSLAALESADAAELASVVVVAGALSAAESTDVSALAGQVVVAGSLDAAEPADAAEISGAVSDGPSGVLGATEAADTAALTGAVDVAGSLGATEGADTASITSAEPAVEVVPVFGGGGDIPPHRRWTPPRRTQAIELDLTEQRDSCEIRGTVDWSGDDEEILLMSEAA